MRQIHGIADAKYVAPSGAVGETDDREVTVTDAGVRVQLFTRCPCMSMTTEQARFLARCLNDAADRVDLGGELA